MENCYRGTIFRVFGLLALCATVLGCAGDSNVTGGPGGDSSGAGMPGGGPMAGASGAAYNQNTGLPPGGGAGSAGTAAGGTGESGAGAGTAGTVAEPMDGGALDDGGSTIIDPAAGSGGSAGTAGTTTTTTPTGASCLLPGNGVYDYPGPYNVGRQDGIDLASLMPAGTAAPTTFSVFYPDPLEANCPHPIVAWGNGTTVTGQGVYGFFNENGASWGMVVISSDNSNVGSGVYQKAGIDYLLQQNQDPSSIFYQKLSTRAGTAGHSQGGMGASAAASHPNVEAEVCVAGAAMGGLPASVAFMCLTGTADMAESGCVSSYEAVPGPAFLGDWEGGDHVTTETVAGYIAANPGTLQMQRLYAAWFRCFLADDQVACNMFRGAPCGICNDPGWARIEGRNIN